MAAATGAPNRKGGRLGSLGLFAERLPRNGWRQSVSPPQIHWVLRSLGWSLELCGFIAGSRISPGLWDIGLRSRAGIPWSARAAAYDAVITSQGAGGAKDTALIEGNVPGVELFTMSYSYASAFLNRQVSMGRQLGKAIEGGPGRLEAELPLLSARASLLLVLPVILDDLIGQLTGASEGQRTMRPGPATTR